MARAPIYYKPKPAPWYDHHGWGDDHHNPSPAPCPPPVPKPAAPTQVRLDRASDTGTIGDGITSIVAPTLVGYAAAGSIVQIYDGNTLVGQGVANAWNRSFSIKLSTLTEGLHQLTLTTTVGGQSSTAALIAVTIDTTAPNAPTALTLDASTDTGTLGDNKTSLSMVKIDGSAAAGSVVKLYDGATLVGTGWADASTGAFVIKTSALANGAHGLTATATDAAGNVSALSTALTITIGPDTPTPTPPTPPTPTPSTGKVSLLSTNGSGVVGNDASTTVGLSADGKKVLFTSLATNLITKNGFTDVNKATDVFVKDLATGAVTLVSSDSSGILGNGLSNAVAFSADGTKVLFNSFASNLAAGDTNLSQDVFIKDLSTGKVTLVSSDANGGQADATFFGSSAIGFSADGTKVLFNSYATNLVPGDTNNAPDVFVKNLASGVVTLVSSNAAGAAGDAVSKAVAFAPDGTHVLFNSSASNLVLGSNPASQPDAYIKDLSTGLVSALTPLAPSSGDTGQTTAIGYSADGKLVLFNSTKSSLITGDTNSAQDAFVKDVSTGTIKAVSTNASGVLGNGASEAIAVSSDGTKVLFQSAASNLVAGDTNGVVDVFVKNLVTGAVTLVSSTAGGVAGNQSSHAIGFSPDGKSVLFTTASSNLSTADTHGAENAFVKNLTTGTITLASIGTDGSGSKSDVTGVGFSADGSTVLYNTAATNLAAADVNGKTDAYAFSLIGTDHYTHPASGTVTADLLH